MTALPDDSSGQASLDTGRFLWESNGDVVEEAIFSNDCAQPVCTTCTGTSSTQTSRFAWPYVAQKTWPYLPWGPVVTPCGDTGLTDSYYPYLVRGYSYAVHYAGKATYKGTLYSGSLTFKGHKDYPLAIVAPDKIYHHSSRLQIYSR